MAARESDAPSHPENDRACSQMSDAELEFTGERYVPGTAGEIAHDHWHRYAFARGLIRGRRVLDAACGEGYGSALLATAAAEVTGVDIDATTLSHARAAYADRRNVRFVEGSAAALPLPDASVDAIVSFETIEHLDAADQPSMLAEFARVLAPDGIVVLSSPNRPEYSDARGYVNPFHRRELDRDELAQLLAPHFPAQRWHRQRRFLGSALWAEERNDTYEASTGDATSAHAATPPAAMYFVVVAARGVAALPSAYPSLSLFTDDDGRELARIDHQASEVLRLDGLLRTRDEELRASLRRTRELEAALTRCGQAVGEHERAEAALARELATRTGERDELRGQVAAQERIILYRQSVRWWFRLPFVRARWLWQRINGA